MSKFKITFKDFKAKAIPEDNPAYGDDPEIKKSDTCILVPALFMFNCTANPDDVSPDCFGRVHPIHPEYWWVKSDQAEADRNAALAALAGRITAERV